MKKNPLNYLLLILISVNLSLAQQNYDIQLSTGSYSLSQNFNSSLLVKPSRNEVFQGYYYRYIQFVSLPNSEQKEELKRRGIELLLYVPHQTYIAAIKQGSSFQNLNSPAIRALHPIKSEYKMLKELADAIQENNFPSYSVNGNKVGVSFTYYETIPHEKLKTHLLSKGYSISSEEPASRSFVVWVKKSKIKSFVAQAFVSSAELMDEEAKPDNNVGRTNIRSNTLYTDYGSGRKFNGSGVNVGIQDDGVIGPHIDYQGRVPNQFLLTNNGDHGDHVSGILMGAGNKDPLMRGMAWGANLYVYAASNYQGFASISTHYTTYGIRIMSTSYSDGCNTGYTTRAQQMDIQLNSFPELMYVFSAGNNGTSNCNYGAGAGWGNVTGGHKHSKNSIAVANLNYIDVRNSSSSRGPAHDGRLKPEVSAVGTDVYSTIINNNYINYTGTSMSCPAVAGLFAQLYQAYKEQNANINPPGALIKAIVMNTADDLGNPGPDFSYGYGRANGLKAVQAIEQVAYLTATVSNASSNSHTIVVPAGVKKIKVMTYWHDPQAQIGAAIALVNNLNTIITDPALTVHNPLILDYTPNAVNLNAAAVPGVDIRNNHEQITIHNPAAGNYVLNVSGANVPVGPQAYFVTWIFETDDYSFIYPIGGEGFNPGETETVRWNALETTGNQTLQYTTDNGNNWITISSAISGAQRYYNWTPPGALSGQCRMRISRGVYQAESDTNFSIIGVPTNLQINWSCPDSVKLSWNPVLGATAYDVYKLGTKYMDSIQTSSTNSCVIHNISFNQEHWFSVRARGPLNAVGRRAIAVQKVPGLFACPPLPVDVACNQILSPVGTLVDCLDLSNVEVSMNVYNPGINTVSVVPVYYRVNNGPVISETLTTVLNASASTVYTFSTLANINGVGVKTITAWTAYPPDLFKYNDTLNVTVSVLSGSISGLPLTEDFETFAVCSTTTICGTVCNLSNGFINESSVTADEHDWRTNNGGTPSNGTGPTTDFSPGTATGKYLYLESTVPCTSLTANMLSPCLDLSTSSFPLLAFAYHMYGVTMGTMHLDIFSQGKWTESIWSASGDQGDEWKIANVDLSNWATEKIILRWRGITGAGSLSDMAIDAINLGSSVQLREQESTLRMMVFPNPSKNVFKVVLPKLNQTNLDYKVSDVSGRVILTGQSTQQTDGSLKIDLQNFAAGIYTLILTSGDKTFYTKLCKE